MWIGIWARELVSVPKYHKNKTIFFKALPLQLLQNDNFYLFNNLK